MAIYDELSGHIAQMGREGFQSARAQELQFYDGKADYEDDRLKRVGIRASKPRMALYGNLPPAKLEAYLYERANPLKGNDDGYFERLLQLGIMPEIRGEYALVDEAPDIGAAAAVRRIFQAAAKLPLLLGPDGDVVPRKISFNADAQRRFDAIFTGLETVLRKPSDRSEHMKSHVSKFRGTLPKLALVAAFCRNPDVDVITREDLEMAYGLLAFYSSHARAIYELGMSSPLASANELLRRLKAGEVHDGFTIREVQRRNWRRLLTAGEVEDAVAPLMEHGH